MQHFFIGTKFVLHYYHVMKNVTITLEEDVIRWARILAAERNMSVSRLISEMLRKNILGEKSYQMAMEQYLSLPSKDLKDPTAKYPTRGDLYRH